MNRPLLSILCLLASSISGIAGDWPQWRGPDRTDVSKETGLLKSWPKDGPKLLWTCSDGGLGYAGPAIVGDRLYTMGAKDESEFVYALDVSSGKEVWACELGKLFQNGWGNGPRGTPTIDGKNLYALGGQGELCCVEIATGKKLWHSNLEKDLGGKMMSGWGRTESLLVDGDVVVCTPGGSKGTIAALDKNSGKVVWRSSKLTDAAAYSSLIIAEADGVKQYVTLTGNAVVGVSAKDGTLLWRHPKAEYRTAVIPTAIYHDGHVYATTGYGAGCDLLKLSTDSGGTKAEKIYSNKKMVNHHGGVVLVGENLFGYSDNERGWVCQNFKSGEIVWKEGRKLGKGSVTFADGRLYCYSEGDGTVALIEASGSGWKEQGRFKIPQQTTKRSQRGKIWTHPVVANGKLYLRDQDLIFCFDIKDQASASR